MQADDAWSQLELITDFHDFSQFYWLLITQAACCKCFNHAISRNARMLPFSIVFWKDEQHIQNENLSAGFLLRNLTIPYINVFPQPVCRKNVPRSRGGSYIAHLSHIAVLGMIIKIQNEQSHNH